MSSDIKLFFHCRRCLEEKPPNISPSDFMRIEAGFVSEVEIQVWCKRHDIEITRLAPCQQVES